jgi:hypothetical protein
LAHGFIHEIHAELPSVEGRDQIGAMLKAVIGAFEIYLAHLRNIHDQLLKYLMAKKLLDVLRKKDRELTSGKVSQCYIQRYIEQLNSVWL